MAYTLLVFSIYLIIIFATTQTHKEPHALFYIPHLLSNENDCSFSIIIIPVFKHTCTEYIKLKDLSPWGVKPLSERFFV